MMTAKRTARVVLGVLVLAGVAICQTKAVRVYEPARRLALVIGNAAYAHNPLVNPEGDAQLVEATLEGLGFDKVVLETNLETEDAMLQAVREFGRDLRANDLAFFYYSGHGQQALGGIPKKTQNYLLPTGYDRMTPLDEVEYKALSFERVREELKAAQLRVIVLDACRTYGKGGGGGLAPPGTARGELIAYATEANAVATDEGDDAGIYAQELTVALRQRGVEVKEVFQNVMERVEARTNGTQHPVYVPRIVGRLYLNGRSGDSAKPWIREWQALEGIESPAMRGSVAAYIKNYKDEPQARDEVAKAEALFAKLEGMVERKTAAERWDEIKDTKDEGKLEEFLQHYTEGFWKGLAERRLKALRDERLQDQRRREAAAAWEAARGAGGRADLVAFVETFGAVAPDLAREAEEMLERLREEEGRGPLGMEFVWVPRGRFLMGSPKSEAGRDLDERQHEVRISRGYWMGKYEVTQGEWEAVMGANPSKFKSCGARCPVDSVSWEDVQEFIRKLNRLESRSGYEYRLPSEAEWEYAARAGSAGATPEGELRILGANNAPVVDGQAWYRGNSGVSYPGGHDCSDWPSMQYEANRCGPHPVGLKRANKLGLHDTLGNVREWTGDWYGKYPSGAVTDPRGPTTGSYRVVRGGSWSGDPRSVRSAFRYYFSSGARIGNVGFRLVRPE